MTVLRMMIMLKLNENEVLTQMGINIVTLRLKMMNGLRLRNCSKSTLENEVNQKAPGTLINEPS